MDKKLITDILQYVENVEETIDNEWGFCRKFEEILQDYSEENKRIPDFYFKLKKMLGD